MCCSREMAWFVALPICWFELMSRWLIAIVLLAQFVVWSLMEQWDCVWSKLWSCQLWFGGLGFRVHGRQLLCIGHGVDMVKNEPVEAACPDFGLSPSLFGGVHAGNGPVVLLQMGGCDILDKVDTCRRHKRKKRKKVHRDGCIEVKWCHLKMYFHLVCIMSSLNGYWLFWLMYSLRLLLMLFPKHFLGRQVVSFG